MGDTTVSSVFPDDELRRGLQQLIRLSRILEPHTGAGTRASLSEVMALGELTEVEAMSQHELARLLGLEKSTVSRLRPLVLYQLNLAGPVPRSEHQ